MNNRLLVALLLVGLILTCVVLSLSGELSQVVQELSDWLANLGGKVLQTLKVLVCFLPFMVSGYATFKVSNLGSNYKRMCWTDVIVLAVFAIPVTYAAGWLANILFVLPESSGSSEEISMLPVLLFMVIMSTVLQGIVYFLTYLFDRRHDLS